MARTLSRIDPDLPLCWEDPHTLRIGFDSACARVQNPSAGEQRLIGAFLTGVDTAQLARLARRLGSTPRETRRLLATLKPVLVVAERSVRGAVAAAPQLRVHVCDDARPNHTIRAALLGTGIFALDSPPVGGVPPDLVVRVERFLEPLERSQRWLAVGIPHLLIRFTDRSIRVGPLVGPSGSPCLACVSLGLVDADPALPALAAQLVGHEPRSETRAGSEVAAGYASGFIRHWLAGTAEVHTTQVSVPFSRGLVSGLPSLETIARHPSCACGDDDDRARTAPRTGAAGAKDATGVTDATDAADASGS